MRIGQMIESVGVRAGGTSTAFLNMLAALRTLPDVQIRAFAAPPPAGEPAALDIQAHPQQWRTVDGYGKFRPGPFGRAVVEEINSGAIDVLHLHGLWSSDLLAAADACRRRDIPYFWEPHGMLVREAYAQKRWKKEIFMALGLRRALQGASSLVFVTREERDHSIIPAGIGPDRQIVVPLPVALPPMRIDADFREAARRQFGIPKDAPAIGFMGRFHHVKRIDMAIRAIAGERTLAKHAWFLIVGGGDAESEAALKRLAVDLGVAERVKFAGWVQGDDKWRALAATDVLTLNSIHENFGYVAVEALAVGTMPVLTSNLALAAELGEAGGAIIAEPTDTDLGRALAHATSTPDWRRTLEHGGGWVRTHLSPQAVGATLHALYASRLARKGKVDHP